ncbi:right-handed parallel beta-helix repeat-containing protein [Anatilimnocola sp. NA78]|uniref:right-handed parallel beta-helix repeat-containing protein n=1 Tax=Anatilimnocola sp. NA78 TaxID=3415683 RepID=UPI003CE51FB7
MSHLQSLRAPLACLASWVLFNPVLFAAERELFVAVSGNDAAAGTAAAPLATIHAAQARIREWRKNGAADPTNVDNTYRITLQAGDYYLTQPIEFTAEDSPGASSQLLITAAEQGQVRLLGGRTINDWRPLQDPSVARRLKADAARQVQVADLATDLLAECGEHCTRGHEHELHPAPLELFYRGEPAPLARWPNQGWATTRAVEQKPGTAKLAYNQASPRAWQSTSDVWAHGFWEADWSDAWQAVTASDLARGTLTIKTSDEVTKVRNNARFCVLNVLEELDQPGEWYLDRTAGKLYFWPPASLASNEVVVSTLDHLVSIYDCQNVTLRNLELSTVQVCAVEIARGSGVSIEHCKVCNTGNLGVHIVEGTSNAVIDCELTQTGEGAIRVSGGDRQTLEPAGHRVQGNDIHHYARTCFAGQPGVLVDGVGIEVRGNTIHHGPDSGIVLQGNEHVVEHNEVYSVCLETSDSGAIYLGHDWTERGNVIKHNVVHHIGRFNRRDVMGVYLDDFASGTVVTHNVFFSAGRAVVIGGGRDNRIEQNTILGGFAGVQVDSRGQTWASSRVANRESLLHQRLAAVPVAEGLYRDRYPQLLNLLSDDPAIAKGNRIADNIIVCPIAVDLQDRPTFQAVVVSGNLLLKDADPLNPLAVTYLDDRTRRLVLGAE